MKKRVSTFLLLLTTVITFSQNSTIKGVIKDNSKQPLTEVTISVKATTKGAQTNENGEFEIKNIENGNYTLLVSYLGFKTKEIQVSILENEIKNLGTIILFEGNEILSEVIIEASRKNKFSRKTSAYVAKMPLKNIENSQVYNTITNQLIVSQSLNTLDDALKNVTGVSKLWASTGRSNDGAAFFSSRGFSVQPQLVNGVAGITNSFINSSNIERIEVIKGPSGTLFGGSVASYGGLINIVTKKPYNGTGGTISASYGSFGFEKLNADINVTDKSEKFSLRFNTGFQNEGSFQDAGLKKSLFMAPAISYKVNNDLTFNLSYEVNSTEQTNGVSLFLNRYATSYYTDIESLNYDTNKSFTDNSVTIKSPTQNYRGEIAWKISDNWSSQSIISGSSANSSGYYTYLWNTADWTNPSAPIVTPNFAMYAQELDTETKAFNAQQNFVGDFKIGGLRNKLLVGVDYLSKKITDNSSNWGYLHTVNLQGDLPYGEPVVNATNLNTALSGSGNLNSDIHQNILGAYVSDVINILPELSFMASVRYDRFQYDGDQNTDSDNETEYTKSTLSPKFGIVYQPILNEVSVFANYQNGFSYVNPQYITDYETGVAITTLQSYDVEEANQLEVGVKTSMFNNKLETTLSYYNITVQNKYLFYTKTQDNKINSQGIEFDVNANPINGLNIHTGFSYNDSKVKDAPLATYLEGLRYQESGPDISYNFWADYQFKEGFAKNFGLGAGFNGTSNYDTMVGYKYVTGSFNLPAYTIFNASAYYETDTFRIGVKANNLTDKTYYSGWSTITPEQPRSFIATLAYKF